MFGGNQHTQYVTCKRCYHDANYQTDDELPEILMEQYQRVRLRRRRRANRRKKKKVQVPRAEDWAPELAEPIQKPRTES